MAQTANEAMVNEILELNLGFDIPEIQNALIITGNISAADAVHYLVDTATNHHTTTMNQLKTELQKLKITNVSDGSLQDALTKCNDNVQKAVELVVKQLKNKESKPPPKLSSQSQSHSNSQIPPKSQRQPPAQPPLQSQFQSQFQSQQRTESTKNSTDMEDKKSEVNSSINNREDAERMKKKLLQEAEMKRKKNNSNNKREHDC